MKEKQCVIKFTQKECFDILKNLIVHKKANNKTYTLILMWLTGLLGKKNYAHLRSIAGGNIIATDINSNTDELIELVHEIIIELMYEKVNYGGKGIGLKHKVGWEGMTITNKVTGESEYKDIIGNEGRAVAFIYTAFKNILYKTLGKNYRGEVNYSNYYNISKRPDMIAFRERLIQEEDPGAVTPEVIEKLKLEGFFPGVHPDSGENWFDIRLYQYRNIYSLGNLRNFTTLSEEIETKGAVISELSRLTNPENYKKVIYEYIVDILNSTSIPKLNREFLKCYYEIPTVIELYNTKKVFNSDMVLFFEMYPDYKKILKVKRLFYSGKRRHVIWMDNNSIVESSKIYKESTTMLKLLLAPLLDKIHQKYEDDLDNAKGLTDFYKQPLDLGSDLHFMELTDVNLEDLYG